MGVKMAENAVQPFPNIHVQPFPNNYISDHLMCTNMIEHETLGKIHLPPKPDTK